MRRRLVRDVPATRELAAAGPKGEALLRARRADCWCGPFAAGLALQPADAGSCGVTPSEQLCLACGLCCDGTLFDGVQLEPGDDAQKLKALGLPVVVYRAKQPITRFAQPCAALCADRTCQLYKNRPRQCRTFECKVFKELRAGETELPAALRLVTKTRRLADKARRLLRKLGDTDEHRSLGERFHRMDDRLRADASDPAALALFADLSLVIHRLKLLAHERFYTRAEKTSLAE
jgi:hypothetical protein